MSTSETPKPKKSTTRTRAKTPSGRASAPSTRRRKAAAPAHEHIATRAYFIAVETGESDPLQNWLRAEQELAAAA